jgi:hypothetical protein
MLIGHCSIRADRHLSSTSRLLGLPSNSSGIDPIQLIEFPHSSTTSEPWLNATDVSGIFSSSEIFRPDDATFPTRSKSSVSECPGVFTSGSDYIFAPSGAAGV